MLTNLINLSKFLTFFMISGSFVYLYNSAINGETIGIVLLTALSVMVLIAFGFGVSLLSIVLFVKVNQATFITNAKENLGIMQKMQGLLASQNNQLIRQVENPSKQSYNPMVIEDGIFEDL